MMWTTAILILTLTTLTLILETSHGMPTKEDLGYFWHVTDFHYDDSYGSSGQSCDYPIPQPGPFGNGSCDSPLSLIQSAVENMATIKPDVDFIIWTGDNAAHIPTAEFSAERNLDMIEMVTSTINDNFPNTQVVPSFGNHDFFPADYTNGTELSFYTTVCDLWSHWIKDPKQIESCQKGGFYSALVQPKLRVLAVNTVLYMTENPKVENLTDPAMQFEWLEKTLNDARTAGEKVIISAHVPPTFPAFGVYSWFFTHFHSRLLDILYNFSDVIVAHHYAHEHLDSFKILQREDESGASPVFLAPSVTPLRGWDSSGSYYPRHNPAIRLVQYDRKSGHHLGYRQFYTNITIDNKQGFTNWRELYNFQDAYHVSDMSVESLREVFNRMKTPNGTAMLQFCSFFYVTPIPDEMCTIQEQATYYCTGLWTDEATAKECIADYLRRFVWMLYGRQAMNLNHVSGQHGPRKP